MINQIKKFLKNDKVLHLIYCFAIVVIFGSIMNVVSGIALALIASFGKEAYDEVKYKGWSWDDLLADLIGIVLGILVL
jgi:hypothetical protein|nr:MAG TPA: putative periplasmic lipoprotein [Caudoviricetes sp.]DAQ75777.1 MAG TPA: putative periplasmic lipoprotein [Caudoviricetes sp.]